MQTHLAALAQFVATLRPEQLAASTSRAARYQLLDMLAAVHAAADAPDALAVLNGSRAFLGGPAGEHSVTANHAANLANNLATVFASGERVHCGVAAAVNAAYSMAHDFDDIVWMGHTCHSAVFAALAVAEAQGASWPELVTAIVAANEVAGRVAASAFLGPLNGQMTTYIHAIGAAAATAKLLRLDSTQTTHALAIALAQPNFALQPAFMHCSAKLLSASVPLQTGMQAAFFAAAGVTGDPALLEDERGFWRHFSYVPLPRMLGDLGEFWLTETLTIKTYPGCHYFQTACEAITRLAERHPLTSANVRKVEVLTNKLCLEVTRFGGAYADGLSPVSVNFDLASTLAVQLEAGRLTTAELDPMWLAQHAADVAAWRARISVRHAPALSLCVIEAALALPAGREAVRSLSFADIVGLRRHYRKGYGSELLGAREAVDWALAIGRSFLAKRDMPAPHHAARHVGSAAPLAFPSQVRIVFADGSADSERIDVPEGSFANAGVEDTLRRKFMTYAKPRLLADADTLFADALGSTDVSLTRFIARAVGPRVAPATAVDKSAHNPNERERATRPAHATLTSATLSS